MASDDEHSADRPSHQPAPPTTIGVAFLPWLVLAVGGMLLAIAGVLFSRDSEPVLRVVVLGVGLFAIAVGVLAFAQARRETPAAREATTSASRSQGLAIAGVCGVLAVALSLAGSLIYGPWMLVFLAPGAIGIALWGVFYFRGRRSPLG